MDMELQRTFLGSIGGLALALLGAGLAVGLSCVGSARAPALPARRARGFLPRTLPSPVR